MTNQQTPQTAASVGVPEEDPPATCKLGITKRGLRCLMQHLTQELGEQLVTMSTKELMDQWVKVVTANSKCRLLELEDPKVVDPKDVRPPTYFISHTCGSCSGRSMMLIVLTYLRVCLTEPHLLSSLSPGMNRALHMFKFVMSYLQDASESVSVWIGECADTRWVTLRIGKP